ncbi:MAG: hypothetical protein NXI32_04015 [bacterium]|nr:hypothetical protein [bacterium]
MSLRFVKHEKIELRKHPILNERWVQDRIEEDPAILGLGQDLRLLDRERTLAGGGRLDLLLIDDDNERRYEIELQLGPTDPNHIIRCIEYWDLERRRYPAYEHLAVLIAEDVTARFLNVMALLSGSIPLIAIQLDALKVDDQILLNFTQVLDQSALRSDDSEDDSGGEPVDRAYWEQKVGRELVEICDQTLEQINAVTRTPAELKYLRGYIGIQQNGVANNFIHWAPRKAKGYTHLMFRIPDAEEWLPKFTSAGIAAVSNRKQRLRISVTPKEFAEHRQLIQEAVAEAVKEFES